MIYAAGDSRSNIPKMKCAVCRRTGYRKEARYPMSFVMCKNESGDPKHIEYCCAKHLKAVHAMHELSCGGKNVLYRQASGEYYFKTEEG